MGIRARAKNAWSSANFVFLCIITQLHAGIEVPVLLLHRKYTSIVFLKPLAAIS